MNPWHQLGFGIGTNRQRQGRGETHLTLNTAPEPEVPPWNSLRPLLQAPFSPRAPAAAGSETRQSCRGSGGWLLGAESTAAGPGAAPSAPAWNRGKAFPSHSDPAGCGPLCHALGPTAPGVARSTRGLACPHSHPQLPLRHALAEGQGWQRWPQVTTGGLSPVNVPPHQDSDPASRERVPRGLGLRRSECPLRAATC